MKTVYDFSVKDRKGKDVSLKEYSNEVLLIVNTATKCGFTPQYDELEALSKQYHSQGFEILDFPCNQFGQQAPDPEFQARPYWQVFQHKHGFQSNLSILDLLFCMGPESVFYIS